MILQSRSAEVSLVDVLLFIHEEGSSVVILLEELVFAFAGFVGDEFAVVAELGPALLLRQVVESVDFSLLLLHGFSGLSVPLDALQLADFPGFVLLLLVLSVSVQSVQSGQRAPVLLELLLGLLLHDLEGVAPSLLRLPLGLGLQLFLLLLRAPPPLFCPSCG